MNRELSGELKEKLRDSQAQAVEKMITYLNSDSKQPALVKMPTGSGKTGIIAVISEIIFVETVIVVVPNSALPPQITKEIENDFWREIDYPYQVEKSVIYIENKKNIDELNINNKYVLIITIQELNYIHDHEQDNFKKLLDYSKLLIFDEGHREFADVWKKIIGKFLCKKILFTATPYRNDKKAFVVDNDYQYKYSVKEAQKCEELCPIEFESWESEELKDIELLAKKIWKLLNENDQHNILVRIDDAYRIEKLVAILNKSEKVAAGFHSTFRKDGDLFNKGKDLYQCVDKYKVFIHNDMLIEGVNIRRIDYLVFVDVFNNMKSIIQQIGRAMRKCSNKKKAIIVLSEDKYNYIKNQWDLYLEYDDGNSEIDYIQGYFKRKFAFDKKFYKDLLLPKRATIYRLQKIDINYIIQAIEERIRERIDLTQIREERINKSNVLMWIMCYEKAAVSRYLKKDYYQNKSLEMTVILKIEDKDLLFYFDTSGISLPKNDVGIEELNVEEYQKLLPQDFIITDAKSSLAMQREIGIQSRTYTGKSLNKIPEDFQQKISICRNISGIMKSKNSNKNIHRYISPVTGRISDTELVDYDKYIKWCEGLAQEMNESERYSYFKRFAYITEKPDSNPTSILIELGMEIQDDIHKNIFYQESIITEVCNNKFQIEINGETKKCEIIFTSSQKIKINIQDINSYVIMDGVNTPLSEYINNSNYQLYYAKDNVFYFNNCYLKPNIGAEFSNVNEWELWGDIVEIASLKDCINEKSGSRSTTDTWPPRSVFASILDEINKKYQDIDYIICDDLNTEMCDFIALSSKNSTCYFIHCKYKEKALSASAFQDVCGQAIKNMKYLLETDFNELDYWKKHENRWRGNWNSPDKNYRASIPRLVKAPETKGVKEFTEEYKRIITSLTGHREVWIVQSGLSKNELKKNLEGKNNRQEQLPQIIWILENARNILNEAGVKLKIFCQP